MYNNKISYTLSEACELLGLDMDKLRYLCVEEYIIPFRTNNGTLKIISSEIQYLKRLLDEQQFRQSVHRKDDPWA